MAGTENYKALLTDEQSSDIAKLAKHLLLDEQGAFKPNTFLTNSQGGIKTEYTRTPRTRHQRTFLWPMLAMVAKETTSPAVAIDLFCRQNSEEIPIKFKEKGHFMRQVLELAKRTKGEDGKPFITTAEANHIRDIIPLDRGRTK